MSCKGWDANLRFARPRSLLMVADSCFWCCVAVSFQECVDHYEADARWYAERCSSGARLLLDDRAVRALRFADAKVIEAGS